MNHNVDNIRLELPVIKIYYNGRVWVGEADNKIETVAFSLFKLIDTLKTRTLINERQAEALKEKFNSHRPKQPLIF